MVLCDRSFRRYVVFLCRSCYVNRKSFSIFQVQKWLKTNGFEFIYLGLSLTSVVEIVPFFFFLGFIVWSGFFKNCGSEQGERENSPLSEGV